MENFAKSASWKSRAWSSFHHLPCRDYCEPSNDELYGIMSSMLKYLRKAQFETVYSQKFQARISLQPTIFSQLHLYYYEYFIFKLNFSLNNYETTWGNTIGEYPFLTPAYACSLLLRFHIQGSLQFRGGC